MKTSVPPQICVYVLLRVNFSVESDARGFSLMRGYKDCFAQLYSNDDRDADCAPSARLITAKSSSTEEEDIDVARERQRVYDGKAQNDLLRICDLTKVV